MMAKNLVVNEEEPQYISISGQNSNYLRAVSQIEKITTLNNSINEQ